MIMKQEKTKTKLNHAIFFSGFKILPTQKLECKTIYTLLDIETNNVIECHFCLNDGDECLSIIYCGCNKLSKIGEKRYNRFLSKVKEIPCLNIWVENLDEEVLSENEIDLLDKILIEENIDIDAVLADENV